MGLILSVLVEEALLVPSRASHRLRGLFSALGLLILASCADTRGGSIAYDRPLAAPERMMEVHRPDAYKAASVR